MLALCKSEGKLLTTTHNNTQQHIMTQSQTFYRFVGFRNENLGISNTSNPELLISELIKDGVDIGGFNLINTNKALCELSQRKDNPLPMDYCTHEI